MHVSETQTWVGRGETLKARAAIVQLHSATRQSGREQPYTQLNERCNKDV